MAYMKQLLISKCNECPYLSPRSWDYGLGGLCHLGKSIRVHNTDKIPKWCGLKTVRVKGSTNDIKNTKRDKTKDR